MNELTKIRDRIIARIGNYVAKMKKAEMFTDDEGMAIVTVEDIINEEFNRAFLEAPNTEQIIKDTIKEYIDKDCDDVTELLLALNKDLCERIRKESENGL